MTNDVEKLESQFLLTLGVILLATVLYVFRQG